MIDDVARLATIVTPPAQEASLEPDQEDWGPLFVGSVVGGCSAENRNIRAAVSRLARAVSDLEWTPVDDETGVDAVFHVTGPLMRPDYTGIRTGRFSRAERLIAIQIAVPVTLAQASEDQTLRALSQYLVDATELAKATVARRKGAPQVLQAVNLAQRAMESIMNEFSHRCNGSGDGSASGTR